MVKNTTGGSQFKKFSRKQNSSSFNYDSLNNPNIITASVSQALGNCRFFVMTNKSEKLLMHIPGRFSGRNKHRNFVTVNSLVKIQLREFENPVKNCDYLQMVQPTTPPSFFIQGSGVVKSADILELEDRIIFKHVEEEEEEKVEKRVATSENLEELEALENINFDDI